MLFNSGSMQNALTFRSTNNSAIVELPITNNKGFPYAMTHQFGASNIEKNKNINIAVDFIKNSL